jgi:hypothetical protein
MGKKFAFSFSWEQATDESAAKDRVSRKIGIPLTRSGTQRKVGRAAGGLVLFAAILGMPLCLVIVLTLGGGMMQ